MIIAAYSKAAVLASSAAVWEPGWGLGVHTSIVALLVAGALFQLANIAKKARDREQADADEVVEETPLDVSNPDFPGLEEYVPLLATSDSDLPVDAPGASTISNGVGTQK